MYLTVLILVGVAVFWQEKKKFDKQKAIIRKEAEYIYYKYAMIDVQYKLGLITRADWKLWMLMKTLDEMSFRMRNAR